MKLSRLWIQCEKFSTLLLLAVFIAIPPKENYQLFELLSVAVILVSLYTQILTFSLYNMIDQKKKGLGRRWLAITARSANITNDMTKSRTFNMIALTVASYMLWFVNDSTLLKVLGIFFIKDIFIGAMYYKSLEKIIEPNAKA